MLSIRKWRNLFPLPSHRVSARFFSSPPTDAWFLRCSKHVFPFSQRSLAIASSVFNITTTLLDGETEHVFNCTSEQYNYQSEFSEETYVGNIEAVSNESDLMFDSVMSRPYASINFTCKL